MALPLDQTVSNEADEKIKHEKDSGTNIASV